MDKLGLTLAGLFAFVSVAPGEAPEKRPTPEKLTNTPGMSLAASEKSRDMTPTKDKVKYALTATGFPKGHRYALYGRRMDGSSIEVSRGIQIDESGSVREPGGEELTLTIENSFRGEYGTFALVSDDRASKAFIEITPLPIQAEGPGGCRLFVRPMEANGQAFLITGSGFKPNEKLKVFSTSVNESSRGTNDGRPDGSVKQVIFPAVVGHTGGDASFEASDSSCTVKVEYRWGDQMRSAPTPAATPAP